MAEQMSLHQIPLTLIVAATPKNGIGKGGGLPWSMMKADMAYFARVTKRVPMPMNTGSVQSDAFKGAVLEGARRNVVIMGRKTWDSIPTKFRPLKDRTHIVISSQDRRKLLSMPDDVVVAPDVLSGLQLLEKAIEDGKTLPVGRAFVIGGSSIYKAALDLPQTKHILLTRIEKDYDCDTFFPEHLNETYEPSPAGWLRKGHADLVEFVGEDIEAGPITQQTDDGETRLEFQLHERV